MKWTHDIVVAGGGPAGCAFTLALRQLNPGLRILVLERSDYQAPRVGETLPPQCRVLLERLGIYDDFLKDGHLPAYGALSSWGSEAAVSQDFITTVQRNGWHLDRNRFDRFMAGKVTDSGVELRQNTAQPTISRLPQGGWAILPCGNKEVIRCRLLVDATGRSASIARLAGASLLRFDRLVGTMAVLDAGSKLDRDTLVEAVPEGWWYSALLPGNKMAAAFFTDAAISRELNLNHAPAWLNLMSGAPLTANRLFDLAKRQPVNIKTWQAQSQRLLEAVGTDWLAVGDAAAAFDPLSSQGIFFALRSAQFAAFAACDLLLGGDAALTAIQKYKRYQLEQFIGYWEVRRDFYQMEQRWPKQSFWQNRHASITLGPEDRVEIYPFAGKKSLFFSKADIKSLINQYPEGTTALEWMRILQKNRPDLPPGHALEGLQALVADGHAHKKKAQMQEP